MNKNLFKNVSRIVFAIIMIAAMLSMVSVSSVAAQSTAPITEDVQIEKDGNTYTVMVLKGYDVNEYGGDDSSCAFTADQPDMIHIGEVVGSPNEACKQVLEWSLKQGDQTIVAGVYALQPHEWFYIPLAVAGVNDEVRVVGTLYRMPKDWNAHMMAAYYGMDRDTRDGTHSFIGLSPTDPWVLAKIDELSGRSVATTSGTSSTSQNNGTTAPFTQQLAAVIVPLWSKFAASDFAKTYWTIFQILIVVGAVYLAWSMGRGFWGKVLTFGVAAIAFALLLTLKNLGWLILGVIVVLFLLWLRNTRFHSWIGTIIHRRPAPVRRTTRTRRTAAPTTPVVATTPAARPAPGTRRPAAVLAADRAYQAALRATPADPAAITAAHDAAVRARLAAGLSPAVPTR